jgi:hypothetical protein
MEIGLEISVNSLLFRQLREDIEVKAASGKLAPRQAVEIVSRQRGKLRGERSVGFHACVRDA